LEIVTLVFIARDVSVPSRLMYQTASGADELSRLSDELSR
jgi:hypothetical protein